MQACKTASSEIHNQRRKTLGYVREDLTPLNSSKVIETVHDCEERIRATYQSVVGQKMQSRSLEQENAGLAEANAELAQESSALRQEVSGRKMELKAMDVVGAAGEAMKAGIPELLGRSLWEQARRETVGHVQDTDRSRGIRM